MFVLIFYDYERRFQKQQEYYMVSYSLHCTDIFQNASIRIYSSTDVYSLPKYQTT